MLSSLCVLIPIKNAVKRILTVYTVFTLFDAVAKSGDEQDDIGFISKALMQRSNITTTGILAILAYFTQLASIPIDTRIRLNSFITLLAICLCILNKAYFDGLPPSILKKRVKALTPVGATALVTLPEVYVLVFIVVEGHHLIGQVAVFAVLGVVALHVLMTSFLNSIE